ncbi:MAG: class I SAM-dependent RNA methyltransferase [Planctomycetota bacterium]|nr:class I SAM-dependent RNA methyltransferase [Planctomycetota bacterium]
MTDHTGVEVRATMAEGMRLVLRLRTAFHLLQRFADLDARTADQMYEQAVRLPWERVLAPDGYVSVASSVRNETIRNSMFANVRLKDAIVDRIAEVAGRRPDSGPKDDRAVVHLFWNGDRCRVSLDLAGRKLSDRGYRKIPHLAPMRETIAAAILMEAGYDGSRPLVVPMCGSGTIAIEAALRAAGRAPGLLRNNFGLQHLLTFDEASWKAERNAARKLRNRSEIAPIIASDVDPGAVEAARRNAVTAGVDHLIRFETCDFAVTPMPPERGTVILHGEYGERMGDPVGLRETYRRIGDFLKQGCEGWRGFVFTSKELAGTIGLRPARRTPFENGGIDCRLLEFELYGGSRPG